MKSLSDEIADRLRRQFLRGCSEFNLLADGDRILVALSGGKDSMALVRLLAWRQRIYRPSIRVEAAHVVMDNIRYEVDIDTMHSFCNAEGVSLTVLHTSFEDRGGGSPCYLCSRYRRKALLDYAVEHGFNKMALGHHQDDFLVTLLMNMNYEGRIDTMRPCMCMEHYPLSVIRPLCRVEEKLISQYAGIAGFGGQKTPCRYDRITHRATMTGVLRYMEEVNPEARFNLWRIATGIAHGHGYRL